MLVTGGAGFIGSQVTAELLRRGRAVRVLGDFSTGSRENLAAVGGEVELVEGDVRSYERTQAATQGVDCVIHLAALPSVPRSIRDPLTSNAVNVTGTRSVVLAARDAGTQRVVFASSSSAAVDDARSTDAVHGACRRPAHRRGRGSTGLWVDDRQLERRESTEPPGGSPGGSVGQAAPGPRLKTPKPRFCVPSSFGSGGGSIDLGRSSGLPWGWAAAVASPVLASLGFFLAFLHMTSPRVVAARHVLR